MNKVRFVVLGDTHFCTHEIRGTATNYLMSDLPDHIRYADMVKNVLSPMFDRIRSLKPDFVISTGDFVEGGMPDDHQKTYLEISQGWELMKTLNCPCLIAKGTHEGNGGSPGAAAYRKIVLPEMTRTAGIETDDEYYIYRKNGAVFLFLDYLNYEIGGKQDIWLEQQLKTNSETAEHIFIVAHPPLYNWGRHFFNEPRFADRIIELCKKYPVDAYLCGHTHNQTVSWHSFRDTCGYLQIMCSSVGYPHMDLIALEDCHALAEFTEQDHFLWGINEDSAPGFYLIEINSDVMSVKWNSFNADSASLHVRKRRHKPVDIALPPYSILEHSLSSSDNIQIKSASINIYGYYNNIDNTELILNGITIGQLPVNGSYAARRYVPLNNAALRTISNKNVLIIKPPDSEDFVIGSISLEILLYDNRVVHSSVCPEKFVSGKKWDCFRSPGKIVNVQKGDTIKLHIDLHS
jgi:calcineurin-like phosphoesterase family protein